MEILLTNDDGIYAPGLAALIDVFKHDHDVFVVAPSDQRSAAGHSITLHETLKVSRITKNRAFYGFAVGGTPADCVKLALCELMDGKPDLVIAGINPGPNTGVSVFYSGTVSAAREAVISGIPAIAVSLASKKAMNFSFAASFTRCLAETVHASALPPRVMLNVNIPAVAKRKIRGVRLTSQAHSRFVEKFALHRRKQNTSTYFLRGELVMIEPDRTSDDAALKARCISITPLKLDLTDRGSIQDLQRLVSKVRGALKVSKR